MICVNCKNCIGFEEGYYLCNLTGKIETVEECVANDDKIYCEGYVDNLDDDN